MWLCFAEDDRGWNARKRAGVDTLAGRSSGWTRGVVRLQLCENHTVVFVSVLAQLKDVFQTFV